MDITTVSRVCFWVALATLVLFNSAAFAQSRFCPEGRTRDGQCVDPGLAKVMRQGAIISTQPKISSTSPLNLPDDDASYPRLPHRFDYVRLFGEPASRQITLAPPNPRTMP